MKERRSHFLINKPLQFRYMFYIVTTLVGVSAVVLISFYFGIWGSVLDAFSNTQIRDEMITASRLAEYENARFAGREMTPSALSFFRQADRLSLRQQEIFKRILDETNYKLLQRCLILLILIAWGSIYLSHKIAGPLYRFQISLEEIEKGNMGVRMHLRDTDEAHFLEVQFNRTAETLDGIFSRLKKIVYKNTAPPDRLKNQLQEELTRIKTSAAP